MSFQVTSEPRTAGGVESTVYQLESPQTGDYAEVWPAHGFNCLRWQASGADLLFVHPDWDADAVPTRSGTPVLFPFPNRIRAGRFRFNEKEYQLPLNDPAKANAIHGFTPRKPWEVIRHDSTDDAAEVVGRFRLSEQAPESLHLWPGDCSLTLTVSLKNSCLRFFSQVENHAEVPVPFGLGFHPYFQLPIEPPGIEEYHLHAALDHEWELIDNLPTGKQLPVSPEMTADDGLVLKDQSFDHLFGGVTVSPNQDGLRTVTSLWHPDRGRIDVRADASFREWIVFTPPHRQAVALEPYTCTTDAANLQEKDIDAGWLILEPGQSWEGVVEFRWSGFHT